MTVTSRINRVAVGRERKVILEPLISFTKKEEEKGGIKDDPKALLSWEDDRALQVPALESHVRGKYEYSFKKDIQSYICM